MRLYLLEYCGSYQGRFVAIIASSEEAAIEAAGKFKDSCSFSQVLDSVELEEGQYVEGGWME